MTIEVTWAMIFSLLLGSATILGLFFWLTVHLIRRGLSSHVKHVQFQVDRVVGVADAAHAEYVALKMEIMRVDVERQGTQGKVEAVEAEVARVKERIGMR